MSAGMDLFRKPLARLRAEYLSGLLTSYVAMAANILAQIVLVPIYLATLGAEGFGALTLILGLITYAAAGIGWVSGGLQRLLGEAYGTQDPAGFAQHMTAGKILLTGYALLAWLVGLVLFVGLPHAEVPLAAAVAAGLFLVASYEAAIERQALSAAGRQAASNLLQTVQTLVYAATVVAVLYGGWGLAGVFVCFLGSVLVARCLVPVAWQGMRPAGKHKNMDALRRLVRRLAGRMGAGYFIAGILVISSQSDVLVVGWLGGAEAAARFVLVWKIAEVGVQILWRMCDSLTPILVRLDAAGDQPKIRARYRRVGGLVLATAAAGGLAYAMLGPWITRLWLGAEHAPQDSPAFALAGLGIVWLGVARLPGILAYSLARFRLWNTICFAEIAARFGLSVVLYPRFGYLAPLVALNIVHLCGIAVAYQWMGLKLLSAGKPSITAAQ